MPVNIQKTVIVDGPQKAVVHFFLKSDGSGELNNELLLDATNDIYPLGVKTETTITQIWWNFSYFDAYLSRADTVPVPIWALNVGSEAHIDFRSFGGLKPPVDLDGSGNILITTAGFAPAGSFGSIVIELKKD